MNKHGQSIIEYALIAVLVILGVVFMGPYVLRSVGAHFKLWDEGIRDSFTETLTQAPANEMGNIATNCPPCSNSQGSCGSIAFGSQCGVGQREYSHNCTPPGCDGAPSSFCQDDPTCCTTPQPQSCGDHPLTNGSAPAGGACPTDFTTAGSGPNCVAPPTGDTNNCYFGYRLWTYPCTSNNPNECVQDPNCPQPTCLGILSPGAYYCANPGSQTPPTGLNINNDITYVANQAACSLTPPCKVYCDNTQSYSLNATGTGCTMLCLAGNMIQSVPGLSPNTTVSITPTNSNYYAGSYVSPSDLSSMGFTGPANFNALGYATPALNCANLPLDPNSCLAGVLPWVHGGGYMMAEVVTNLRTISLTTYESRWSQSMRTFVIADTQNKRFLIGYMINMDTTQTYYQYIPWLNGEVISYLGDNTQVTDNAGCGGGSLLHL